MRPSRSRTRIPCDSPGVSGLSAHLHQASTYTVDHIGQLKLMIDEVEHHLFDLLVCRFGICKFKSESAVRKQDAQQQNGCPLIAVAKGVVASNRLYQRGAFFCYGAIVSAIGSCDC